jgi:hypothetical protein
MQLKYVTTYLTTRRIPARKMLLLTSTSSQDCFCCQYYTNTLIFIHYYNSITAITYISLFQSYDVTKLCLVTLHVEKMHIKHYKCTLVIIDNIQPFLFEMLHFTGFLLSLFVLILLPREEFLQMKWVLERLSRYFL